MKVLIVLAHPRRDSLTGQIADAIAAGLKQAGHQSEIADLHGEGFDPLLMPEDEPDWGREDKVYSDAVRREMARLDGHEAVILVFPIWWWSFPAMLKGWVDRVWNKDYAYGSGKLGHRKALAVGLSACDAQTYARTGQDAAMESQIVDGLFRYCGIDDARFIFLHQSTDGASRATDMIREAHDIGRTFA